MINQLMSKFTLIRVFCQRQIRDSGAMGQKWVQFILISSLYLFFTNCLSFSFFWPSDRTWPQSSACYFLHSTWYICKYCKYVTVIQLPAFV
jgi:hypothetical protein